jgi:hypothetical protein
MFGKPASRKSGLKCFLTKYSSLIGSPDFTLQPDTRDALLQHIRKHPEQIDPAGETVRQILSVQSNFFDFESIMLKSALRPEKGRLAFGLTFDLAGIKCQVNCFNTAWVSTNPEVPGTLVFPATLVKQSADGADLQISAFHHPPNWLTPENSRRFRVAVEGSSDLILTGHEHETSVYGKQDVDTGSTQHVEGAVLQVDGSSDYSAFHVIAIDDKVENYEVSKCEWKDDKYIFRTLWSRPFIRNTLARKALFQHSDGFSKSLADPGLPILHPRKHDITIDDLFIYPALALKDPAKKFQVLRTIESPNVLEFVRVAPRLVIVGDEMSGKTCFAKRLCRDLLSKSAFVPILVKANDISGFQARPIRRLLRDAAEEQFGEEWAQKYLDLDVSQRAIIVDDWHTLKYAAKGKAAVVEQLNGLCGKTVLLSSRLYALEELADAGAARKLFADFQFCDIQEFGKRSTGRLIEKWHALGHEDSVDPRDFHYAVACSEDKVAAVIRTGVLPTFPIFIIGLLQADVSSSSTASRNAGAYGHILELIITDRLSLVSKSGADIGTMRTYLSRIAYSMFTKDRAFLSGKEIGDVHSEYCSVYAMRLSETQVLANIIAAKIICKEGDSYRFAYKGLYCYSVARYLFENIGQAESALRPQLDDMTDRLAWEDYTNIVMFYLYLSRDPRTIDRLLTNAAKIYSELQPATLDDDVTFVNRLIKGRPQKLLLPDSDISARRDEYRQRQDTIRQSEGLQEFSAPNNRVPYASTVHELVKIAIALQTLRVMGQVLRNFPGVLQKEPKLRLAEESYLLGLRLLRRVLDLAEHQMQDLRTTFAEILKEADPFITQAKLEQGADQALIWLTGAAAYGVIKKISRSVGLKDLELTFEQVRKEHGALTSVKLVHLSILLEYFRDVPKSEIYELEKSLRRNNFSHKVLRDLVSEFLYLRNTDFRLSQEMGELFDIETSKPTFMLHKAVGVDEPGKR